jgi:cytochrome c oxidase subunit 3
MGVRVPMTNLTTDLPIAAPPARRKVIQDSVLGMSVFIFTEIMLFIGLISAFVIARASVMAGFWPPPGQPRLPVEATLINTAALLVSGVVLLLAYRAFVNKGPRAARLPFGVAILLGAFFVGFQGAEWLKLIGEGLTMTSSLYGAFFYLVVGAHAVHATGALIALVVYWFLLRQNRLTASAFAAVSLFWYFVVLMWPILYWKVYL